MNSLIILLLISVTKLGNWLVWVASIVTAMFGIWKLKNPVNNLVKRAHRRINRPALEQAEKTQTLIRELGEQILSNQQEFRGHIEELKDGQKMLGVIQKSQMERNKELWWISNELGYTIDVSPTLSRYMGLAESEQEGSNWLNNVPFEYHDTIMKAWKHSIEHEQDFKLSYPFIKGDKSLEWFEAHAKKAGLRWFGVLTPIATPNKKKMQAMA